MTTLFTVALTIAITISVSLILVLISHLRRQDKEQRLLAAFEEAAAEFSLSISRKETLSNLMIGLDIEKEKLLFLEASRNKYEGYLVDLKEIESCRVRRAYEPQNAGLVNKRAATDANVKKITLQFDYKNGTQSIALPFYNKATDPISEMHVRGKKAEGWQALLSTLFSRRSKTSEHQITYAARDRRNLAYAENESLLCPIVAYC